MARFDLDGGLVVEVSDDSTGDFCMTLARESLSAGGRAPEDDGLVEELAYDVIEPELLKALEDALERAVAGFPRDAGAWADRVGAGL